MVGGAEVTKVLRLLHSPPPDININFTAYLLILRSCILRQNYSSFQPEQVQTRQVNKLHVNSNKHEERVAPFNGQRSATPHLDPTTYSHHNSRQHGESMGLKVSNWGSFSFAPPHTSSDFNLKRQKTTNAFKYLCLPEHKYLIGTHL